MTTTTTVTYDADTLVRAFTTGDCWALALALHERYQGLTIVALAEDEEEGAHWIHVLVRDERYSEGHGFVDIMGVGDMVDVTINFDDDPDWDLARPLTPREIQDLYDVQPRYFPEVPVEAGIDHIIAGGWTPPPLRNT